MSVGHTLRKILNSKSVKPNLTTIERGLNFSAEDSFCAAIALYTKDNNFLQILNTPNANHFKTILDNLYSEVDHNAFLTKISRLIIHLLINCEAIGDVVNEDSELRSKLYYNFLSVNDYLTPSGPMGITNEATDFYNLNRSTYNVIPNATSQEHINANLNIPNERPILPIEMLHATVFNPIQPVINNYVPVVDRSKRRVRFDDEVSLAEVLLD
jgi:hypothetical protein